MHRLQDWLNSGIPSRRWHPINNRPVITSVAFDDNTITSINYLMGAIAGIPTNPGIYRCEGSEIYLLRLIIGSRPRLVS
jgi:hypothetical protein